MSDTLYPEDTIVRVVATQRDAVTNVESALSGILTGEVRIAASPLGVAINSLSATLTETPTAGTYAATLDGAAIAAALADVPDGAVVYRVTRMGADAAPVATRLTYRRVREG